MSDSDKRTHGRMETATEVKIYRGEDFLGRGSGLNLSEGGIFLAYAGETLANKVNQGETVRFEFTVPTGSVSGSANIAWIDTAQGKFGLRFQQLDSPDGLNNLLSYVHSAFCGAD